MSFWEGLYLPIRISYRKETGMMAVPPSSILTCDEVILARSRCCFPGSLDTLLFFFFLSLEFKVSGAGSREEEFQRLRQWGKVWVIKHWRCLKVPIHVGATPTDCISG